MGTQVLEISIFLKHKFLKILGGIYTCDKKSTVSYFISFSHHPKTLPLFPVMGYWLLVWDPVIRVDFV